jgi:magnesium-transporting ATPase (P-type)
MLVFTTNNAMRVWLMQLGVIVFGILATAASYKSLEHVSLAPSDLAVFLMNYGFLLLLVPVTWIAVAIRWKNNPAVSDGRKALIFIAGLIALLVLAVMVVLAAGAPWLRLAGDWGRG